MAPKGKIGPAKVAVVGRLAAAKERVRNRASPFSLVNLYEHLSPDQKEVVVNMGLGSMLNIRCSTLHNPVINWLAPTYDRFTRESVIPGRGRIPLNADSVYRIMGLPRGGIPVTYCLVSEIDHRLRPAIFPDCAKMPETTKVFNMLKEMTAADEKFKQLWIMYLTSTVLAPTSLNKVSSRCYPIMVIACIKFILILLFVFFCFFHIKSLCVNFFALSFSNRTKSRR